MRIAGILADVRKAPPEFESRALRHAVLLGAASQMTENFLLKDTNPAFCVERQRKTTRSLSQDRPVSGPKYEPEFKAGVVNAPPRRLVSYSYVTTNSKCLIFQTASGHEQRGGGLYQMWAHVLIASANGRFAALEGDLN
jgi:hypothetical protein